MGDSDQDLAGYRGPQIKPSRSLLSYLKSYFLEGSFLSHEGFPLPTEKGDFDFNEYKCQFPYKPTRERDNAGIVVDFLVIQANFYWRTFPNASISVVLPSEYYGDEQIDNSSFEAGFTAS